MPVMLRPNGPISFHTAIAFSQLLKHIRVRNMSVHNGIFSSTPPLLPILSQIPFPANFRRKNVTDVSLICLIHI